jgi:hypothetical protein
MTMQQKINTLALAVGLALAGAAHAAPVTYEFTGFLNGFGSQAYTGTLTFDAATPGVTSYYDGSNAWELQGYGTVYAGAISELSIDVGGQIVSQVGPGGLNVFNLEEAKYAISAGLSMITFPLYGSSSATGSIDGTPITNLYLSFYDTTGYIDTSTTLPGGWTGDPNIDPALTGTSIPALPYGEYFLGMNFGLTNTVNGITSFTLAAPVPEAETYAMFLSGLGVVALLARRRRVALGSR